MSWLAATLLALYNLHLTQAPSNRGFYHWRGDVCTVVSSHWLHIFGPGVKKKKTWQGSVSGSLSGNSGSLFESGLPALGEQGWWRLRSLDLPSLQLLRVVPREKARVGREGREARGEVEELGRRGSRVGCSSLALAIARKSARDGLVAIPVNSKKEKARRKREERRRGVEEERTGVEEMEQEEEMDKSESEDDEEPERSNAGGKTLQISSQPESPSDQPDGAPGQPEELQSSQMCSTSSSEPSPVPTPPYTPLLCHPSLPPSPLTSLPPSPLTTTSSPLPTKEVTVTSLLADTDDMETTIDEEVASSMVEEEGVIQEEEMAHTMEVNQGFPELFQPSSVLGLSRRELHPGCDKGEKSKTESSISKASETEAVDNVKVKNEHCGTEFKLEAVLEESKGNSSEVEAKSESVEGEVRVLDRFQGRRRGLEGSLVVSGAVTTWVTSPYSGNLLKPFIRRDQESTPAGLALLRQIEERGDLAGPLHPIDFCYLQPNLVPAVNCLAEKVFWPGIDVSEGLQYPDFSCVALYRRLCVGFGLVVPDTRWSESYLSHLAIHPAWRGAGLATFILYHLIQTNLGKDLTLHVSASNPALLLYQRFGFKVEEFVTDFYLRYLPPHSSTSPHALLLRLAR